MEPNKFNELQNFFYFNGQTQGIQITNFNRTSVKWPFENGLNISLWFYIEDSSYDMKEINEGIVKVPKLFVFHSQESGGGGLQAYFIGTQLFYRVLPIQYTDPIQGSNGLLIGNFKPKVWYYLNFDHEGPKIIGRSVINITLNNEASKSFILDFPQISSSVLMSKFSFGQALVGKISSVLIFNSQLALKQNQNSIPTQQQHFINQILKNKLNSTYFYRTNPIFGYFNTGFQTNNCLKNMNHILDKSSSKLYMLLTPIRTSEQAAYDCINGKTIGLYSENCGFHSKILTKAKINFFGGFEGLLPMFYLLRFIQNDGNNQATENNSTNNLNSLLRTLVSIMQKRPDNQLAAIKLNMFKIVANLLAELGLLNRSLINQQSVQILTEIKTSITEPKLLDQFFLDFLWNMDLIGITTSSQSKNEFFVLLKSIYMTSPQHFNQLFGVREIINHAVQKCDAKGLKCCYNHSLCLGLLVNQELGVEFNNYIDKVLEPLMSIVESILSFSNQQLADELFHIVNVLIIKLSPCFQIQIFKLLMQILIEKCTQNAVVIKKFIRTMIENQAIHTFLFVLNNSPCIQIKALSIKFISFLVNQQINVISEFELSQFISSILWNLNAQKNVQERVAAICSNLQDSRQGFGTQSQSAQRMRQIERALLYDDFDQKEGGSSQGTGSISKKEISFNLLDFEHQDNEIQQIGKNFPNPIVHEVAIEEEQAQNLFGEEDTTSISNNSSQTPNNKAVQGSLQSMRQKLAISIDNSDSSDNTNKAKEIKFDSTDLDNGAKVADVPQPQNQNFLTDVDSFFPEKGDSNNFYKTDKVTGSVQNDNNLLEMAFTDGKDRGGQPVAPSMINKRKPGGGFNFFKQKEEKMSLSNTENLLELDFNDSKFNFEPKQKFPLTVTDLGSSNIISDNSGINTDSELSSNYFQPPQAPQSKGSSMGFDFSGQNTSSSGSSNSFSFPVSQNQTAGLVTELNNYNNSSQLTGNSNNNNENIGRIPKETPKSKGKFSFKNPNLKLDGVQESSNTNFNNSGADQDSKIFQNIHNNIYNQINGDKVEDIKEAEIEESPANMQIQVNASDMENQMELESAANNLQEEEEERKNSLNSQPVISEPPVHTEGFKKPFFKKPMNIDTEEINLEYNYGGEQNKRLGNDELDKESQEIEDLARVCVQYMNGEIQQSADHYQNYMPQIPQAKFNAPMSVRGVKNLGFGQNSSAVNTLNIPSQDERNQMDLENNELNPIMENSLSGGDLSSFRSLDYTTGLDQFQTVQKSPLPFEFNFNQNKFETAAKKSKVAISLVKPIDEIINFEPLYSAIMEWILHRTPKDIKDAIIIDDSDQILSIHVIQVLISFYTQCDQQMKPRLMHDLFVILKWNPSSAVSLLNYSQFHYWLLEILFSQQERFFFDLQADEAGRLSNSFNEAIWNSALKIHSLILKQSIVQEVEAAQKVQTIFMWLETRDPQAKIGKYLLRAIWTHLLQSLSDATLLSSPYLHNPFWRNIVQLTGITLEIVISVYNLPYIPENHTNSSTSLGSQSNHNNQHSFSENMKTLRSNFTFIQPSDLVPRNYRAQVGENQWIDSQLISLIFNLLEPFWPESMFSGNVAIGNSSEIGKLEKKIGSLLEFSHSEDFAKVFEIFMHECFEERLIFIKAVNLMITSQIDDLITGITQRKDQTNSNSQLEELEIWINKLERIFKLLVLISENTREKIVLEYQSQIYSNILYLLRYLYRKLDHKGESGVSITIEVKDIIERSISRVGVFMLMTIDHINSKYGHFDNYQEQQSALVNFSLSPMIPNINLILYEIFHQFLNRPHPHSEQTIVSTRIIEELKKSNYQDIQTVVFSSEWVQAFSENHRLNEIIQKNFDDNFHKIAQSIRSKNQETVSRNLVSVKMNEQNREDIIRRYDSQIYEHTIVSSQFEELGKNRQLLLNQANVRVSRNLWKKIWQKQRVFNRPWRAPNFKAQNDFTLQENKLQFNKDKDFLSTAFHYQIDKFEIQNRARPFLKIQLHEPAHVQSMQSELEQLFRLQTQHLNLCFAKNSLLFGNVTESGKDQGGSSINLSQSNAIINFGKSIGQNISKTLKMIIPNNLLSGSTSITQQNSSFPSSAASSPPKTQIFTELQKSQHLTSPSLHSEELLIAKQVQWVKSLTVRNGTLCITSDKLLFQYEYFEQKESHICCVTHRLLSDRKITKEWNLEDIKEIYLRRYIMRQSAIEIIYLDGSSNFFNFPNFDHDEFLQKIVKIRKTKCPNLQYHKTFDARKLADQSSLLKKWVNHEISNFQYLMYVNSLGSRSFKDITQYHVFPWIFSQYSSREFPAFLFNDTVLPPNETIFRDLKKTIGNLGSAQRRELYIDRFNTALQTQQNDQDIPPFHYGSHYNSAAIVSQYLIRIMPFTETARIIQGGKFDLADRLFFSMQESWNCTTSEVADVRELLPEFFYMPEIYLNLANLDFGVQQLGKRVNNVELPQWAQGDPFRFVAVMKRALESEHVSSSINHWIDLIFGFKQRGQQAENALNVFYYMTYDDKVEWEKIKDESMKVSMETQIVNFGQTPLQVYLQPHVARGNRQTLFPGQIIADSNVDIKVYRPINENNKGLQNSTDKSLPNIFNILEQSIIKMKWIDDQKLIGVRRDGKIIFYRQKIKNLVHDKNSILFLQKGGIILPSAQGTVKQYRFSVVQKNSKVLLFRSRKVNFQKFQQIKTYIVYFLGELTYSFDKSLQRTDYPLVTLSSGQYLVLGGFWDGRINIIEIQTDNMIQTFTQHSDTVTCLITDAKENFLISGSKSGEVILWKINSDSNQSKLQIRYQYFDHREQITSLYISSEMRAFATSSLDGSINFYNILNGYHYRTINHPQRLPIHNVFLSATPICSVQFFSNSDRTLYSYSANGQLIQKVQDQNTQLITALTLLKDHYFSDYIVYSSQKGVIYIRDLPFLNLHRTSSVSPNTPILSLVSTHDKKFLLCGCCFGDVAVLTDPQVIAQNINAMNLLKEQGQVPGGNNKSSKPNQPQNSMKIQNKTSSTLPSTTTTDVTMAKQDLPPKNINENFNQLNEPSGKPECFAIEKPVLQKPKEILDLL